MPDARPAGGPSPGPDGPALRPVVVQHARTGEVLMVAYADDEALRRTLAEGRAWFFSRRRGRLWCKGETSGHGIHVTEVLTDCDGDALLYLGEPQGPACHTGERSCFFRRIGPERGPGDAPSPAGSAACSPAGPETAALEGTAAVGALERLAARIAARTAPTQPGSYTARLLAAGPAAVARKVGEEAVELILAALAETPARAASEAADLVYHALVLLQACGAGPESLARELARRLDAGPSGPDRPGAAGR